MMDLEKSDFFLKFYYSGGELFVSEAMYWVVAYAYIEGLPLDELVLCAREQEFIL